MSDHEQKPLPPDNYISVGDDGRITTVVLGQAVYRSGPAETLEQWAERVAPTLDADGWSWARAAFHEDRAVVHVMIYVHGERLPSGASVYDAKAALMVVRDRVVEGLSPTQRTTLRAIIGVVDDSPPTSCQARVSTLFAMQRKGVVGEGYRPTNLGRECARVLRGRS